LPEVARGCPDTWLKRPTGASFRLTAGIAALEYNALEASLISRQPLAPNVLVRASTVDLDHQILRLHLEGSL
jgi:hypothetical protein